MYPFSSPILCSNLAFAFSLIPHYIAIVFIWDRMITLLDLLALAMDNNGRVFVFYDNDLMV